MNKADASTVFHEVGHAFIFKTLGDTNTANAVKSLLTAAQKGLNANSVLAKRIKAFGKAYAEQGILYKTRSSWQNFLDNSLPTINS